MIDLEKLSDNDSYSLLFILMSKVEDKPPYSILSELSYIMDKESFLNFISFYGGATIKIPTAEELHKAARILVLYQSYVNQKLSWKESLKIAGYDDSESLTAKMELGHFIKVLDSRGKN